jgi:GDP/UDP-N,N'-diacetylbacillosamine 2-epimerase (hydrolysing)
MRKILVFSVGRSDFDRYYPFLESLGSKKIIIKIYASQAHFSNKFGNSVEYIKNKGFEVINYKNSKNKFFLDNSFFISQVLGKEIKSFAKYLKNFKPDIIFVLGDRYEMLAAPCAAITFNIPIFHFYGGAITEGATDELVRHSITKMSHFHFVALNEYKKRLIRLGEESWRIKVIGIPNIKYLKKKVIPIKHFSRIIGLDFTKKTILCTFHSSTLELLCLKKQLDILCKSIKKSGLQCVFTYPNADRGHDIIIKKLKNFVRNEKKYILKKYCKPNEYANLLRYSSLMIGNSSSGIVEAASFGLPVINLGTRQDGKVKPRNVIDVKYNKSQICKLILTLKKSKIKNPYESNFPMKKFNRVIADIKINDSLLRKKFI